MPATRKTKTFAPETADAGQAFEPDAYVLRTCAADGGSHNGFRWPLEVGALVEAPDWEPTAECGHGLHGLLDGIGDWSLIDGSASQLWQVIGVRRAEVVVIDDAKVKFPRGRVIYTGTAAGALSFIQPKMVAAILEVATGNIATGDSGHAAATGDSGHAAATGYRGHAAATGDSGHAAATGYSGHAAATGARGHAAATGYSGHAAATGENAIAASLGWNGTAMAGPNGWIVLAAYDDVGRLLRIRTAKVGGEEGIKPETTYRLTKSGEFEEVGK